MRRIERLTQYPAIERIFECYKDDGNAVFLDSSLRNDCGRYSIIGLYPYLELVNGEQFTVNGEVREQSFDVYVRDYLEQHREENDTGLPIISGAIGYFSYDYGMRQCGVVSQHPVEVEIPDCILCFYDVFIIEDHREAELFLVANGQGADSGVRITALKEQIAAAAAADDLVRAHPGELQVSSNFRQQEYLAAIDQMINYIVEGDIYIANMTRQLRIKANKSPYDLFKRLRQINPSPFGGYFNYGTFQVVSASPERFLRMRDRHVVTRPIKGTRKRGATPEEDLALRIELENSAKDQSELLMIVDLERNDLNRVCIPGTVTVTELFSVEAYATVFHLVANVEGQLPAERTVMDLIAAAFPGGSITGAPKQRAMEIIDQLEHGRRNLYTGSMGYIGLDGSCDFNIVIRTAVYRDGIYHLGVGGGITCESELEFEYEETSQKAKAILEALK